LLVSVSFLTRSFRRSVPAAARHGNRPLGLPGFTLIELLVVIAIIGVLVGLLLPAVQQAREAARRTACGNKLKQLGLAALNYVDVRGRLPYTNKRLSGGWGQSVNHKGSFFVQMLPYMEQNTLYDGLDFTSNTQDVEWQVVGGKPLYAHVLPELRCPSDQHRPDGTYLDTSTNQTRACSNYSGSMGSQNNNSCSCATHNNHFGNGPVVRADTEDGSRISGVIGHVWWSAKLKEITDGQSKTILFGEVRPQCAWHIRKGWCNINSVYTGTGIAINFNTCEGEPGTGSGCSRHSGQWACSQGFKSRHPGGAFFAFCDGSVQFLQETINMVTYQALGDRRDGTTFSW
jgi:prepilin-type N-terminal cleavage/methylation domain-containing protein/prepilin-type processing-associated H-X9-DG protein